MSDYIIEAAKLIWYDNGMINKLEREEVKLYSLINWLNTMDVTLVGNINNELSLLTKEELYNVCCGCESELIEQLLSNDCLEILVSIFDEEYE